MSKTALARSANSAPNRTVHSQGRVPLPGDHLKDRRQLPCWLTNESNRVVKRSGQYGFEYQMSSSTTANEISSLAKDDRKRRIDFDSWPHPGHVLAVVEILWPHSLHFVIAIAAPYESQMWLQGSDFIRGLVRSYVA